MYNIDLANVKSIVADIVAKHNVENVAFVGCGASKAELYPAKYFLANCSKKLRVAHYTANEFNYDIPDWLGDTTVVITASLGGSTPETVKANSVAKAAGATVISVTHAAGSALTTPSFTALRQTTPLSWRRWATFWRWLWSSCSRWRASTSTTR